MGRKKIQISRITDERNRQVTFNKRKFGVMKKAYELSVLCDCEIALIIFSSSNKLYQYASTDMDKVLLKYTEYNEPHESLTNKNIIELQVNAQKENKNGTMSPDSPEPEDSYTLTPRTEAKYNKIDEDFQIMMQRNQQLTAGGARPNMATNSYSLPVSVPVSVPVIGTYNDSMLQSSPQMAHNSISPRPSSSETDSVYPSGGILEMSNGYPHSASPLGGSPSPGPSPGIGSHQAHNNNNNTHNTHNKKFHFDNAVQTIKQSPSGGSGSSGSRSLRVVIPAPMNPTITADDISYVEHTRQQTNLNTPVVALQTPIPGLTNYTTTLGSFGAQDFSLNPDIMIGPWSAASSHSQNSSAAAAAAAMGSLQHSSGLPHLAVSNSTPPPSTSPLSVKIKAEPISPPRDHHNTSHHHGVPGGGSGGSTSTASSSAQGANGVQSASGGASTSTGNSVNASGGNNSSNNGSSHSQQQNGSQQQLTAMGNVVVTGGGAGASSLGANLNHTHLIHSRPSSTGHLTPTPDSYMPIGGHLAGSVTPTNAPSPPLKTGGGGGGGNGNRGTGDGSACYLDDNSNHVVVISDADGGNTSDRMGNSVANFTHKLHQHLPGHGGSSAHQQYHHHLQQHHHQHQQQQQSSQLLHPFYNQHHHHVQQQHLHHQHHHSHQAGSSGNNSNHGYSSQPTSPYHNHNSNSSEPKHLQGSHSPSPGVTPGPSGGSLDAQSQAIAMQQHY
uniref:MADS-box domain-containing protein n=2 Tax=Culicidae TaxID=7157 RepID=A0A182P3M1_9DIPT